MMDTIRFERADLDLFSAASHDRNPLHLCDQYARRTAYGEPVVFGIFGALAALGCLGNRWGQPLRSAGARFS